MGPDNRQAGFLATQHLLEHGHRRIAWLRGYPRAANARLREEGYRDALSKNGIPVEEPLTAGDNFGVKAGEAAVEELLRNKVRFTAIAATTDLQACGAIRVLRRNGFRVPGDVSVIGCSDLDFSAASKGAETRSSPRGAHWLCSPPPSRPDPPAISTIFPYGNQRCRWQERNGPRSIERGPCGNQFWLD